MSLLSFFAMMISVTRSSWIALAVASIFGIIYIIKNFNKDILKRTIILASCFTIIFIFVLKPPTFIENIICNYKYSNFIDDRFKSLYNDFDNIVNNENLNSVGSGRLEIWYLTLKLTSQVPLLGTGPDTLKDGIIYKLPLDALNYFYERNAIFDKAHNEYLQIAATIGIPALIIYLAFLMQILFNQKNLFKNSGLFILIIPIIAYITQAFSNISTIGVAPIFWFLLGVIQNKIFVKDIEAEDT